MKSSDSILGTVAVGVVGIIGFSLIIKMVRSKRQQKSGDRPTTDDNVRIAQELNTAIHPGRSFISNMFFQPNKDEIFRIGAYIEDFKDISEEYRNLYQITLSLELQDALGDDYPDFINLIKKVESGTNTYTDAETQVLASKLEAEMIGLNWLGRNIKPFNDLLRLSDENFKKVIEIYNTKYPEKFIKTFKGEYSMSLAGSLFLFESKDWIDIEKKITKRYYLIF